MRVKDYGSYSFWLENSGDDLTPRPALDGSTEVDVAILGAGFTGLWTAYCLLRRDPSLSVLVVEREIAGFGASGRNGGWCVADFPVSPAVMTKRYGREASRAVALAMIDSVDDIGRVTREEGIDAHYAHGGALVHRPRRVRPAKDRRDVGGVPLDRAGRPCRALRRGSDRGADAGRGRRWLLLDAGGCRHPTGASGARAGPRGRAPRRAHRRTDDGHRLRRRHAAATDHRPRRGAGAAGDRPRRRGLPVPVAEAAPPRHPDDLAHGRHRAAAAGDLGADRLGAPRRGGRVWLHRRLPQPHRRRAHRLRRLPVSLPVRLPHQRRPRPHGGCLHPRPARGTGLVPDASSM